MSKPTIFFSHSSHDQNQLVRLKELFIEKTGGSIDVFLSSDGQSIPLGRNWVHQIEQALEHTPLMVVFVSPNFLRSSWLFFESGFAYSKKIRVVPVGFLGLDLAMLPPPLSLLQGFNIVSESGLNNLIAVANEVFDHSHLEAFNAEEFQEVCGGQAIHSSTTFGDNGKFIDQIQVDLSAKEGLSYPASDAMTRIADLFDRKNLKYERSEHHINLHGISLTIRRGNTPPTITIDVDPTLADVAIPIIETAIREVKSSGVNGTKMSLQFIPTVGCILARYKITGRTYGTDVTLAEKDCLVKGDIKFNIGRQRWFGNERVREGPPYLIMELLGDGIPCNQVRELVSLLFDRGILFLEPDGMGYNDYV